MEQLSDDSSSIQNEVDPDGKSNCSSRMNDSFASKKYNSSSKNLNFNQITMERRKSIHVKMRNLPFKRQPTIDFMKKNKALARKSTKKFSESDTPDPMRGQ